MIDHDLMDYRDIKCLIEVMLMRLDDIRDLDHLIEHRLVLQALGGFLMVADGNTVDPDLRARYQDHDQWNWEQRQRA